MTDRRIISFDYAIKYLLRDKADYDIVEGFISALLNAYNLPSVKINALLESESNKEHDLAKRSLADLIVEDQDKNKYIVEIERSRSENFMEKSCFNTSRMVVDSISKGVEYNDIKKIFHITILYFTPSYMNKPTAHGKVVFHEEDTEHPMHIRIIDKGNGAMYDAGNVFPEYFIISVPLFEGKIRKDLDEWLYVMKESEIRSDFKSPYMKKVAEKLGVLKMLGEERDNYYRYMKDLYSEEDRLQTAQKEGMEKGRKEGRKEGMERAIESLLSSGMPAQEVSERLSIPLSEVKKMIH